MNFTSVIKSLLKHIVYTSILAVIFFLILMFIIIPIQEKEVIESYKERLNGTWQDIGQNTTFTFFSNLTFSANKKGTIYNGTWEITAFPTRHIRLNWGYAIGTYQPFFSEKGTKLQLYGTTNNERYDLVKI